MIERKIVIGLITNTEYLRQLQDDWNPDYMESGVAKLLANWCWEYFKKYEKAPMRDIETIYIKKLKKGLDEDLAEEIESEILPKLSEEYETDTVDITYLLQETREYFQERQIAIHTEVLSTLLEKNKVTEAKQEVEQFTVKSFEEEEGLDLSSNEVLKRIEVAFDTEYQNLIKFPGALGQFWNDELVRGGFVALMGPEKRGKTYWLMEFMMRAYKQGRRVAFFQAGDMTESQQLVRICIYLAQKSNKEQYCGKLHLPVLDCIKNQTDTCDKPVRECQIGLFNEDGYKLRKTVTKEQLLEVAEEFPKYKNCYNCSEFAKNKWGTVWLKEHYVGNPLTTKQAQRYAKKFFVDTKRSIKLSTHINGTLTLSKIKSVLGVWERKEKFVPDVIIIDYADLLVAEKEKEHRHQHNEIWKGLRALSQKYNCLVVTATQTDGDSYKRDRLELSNYSEDKRKYGHVTAVYGLNQDTAGREKEIGIMRINKMVVREGDFHSTQEVYVMQRLQIGRPFLGSYF